MKIKILYLAIFIILFFLFLLFLYPTNKSYYVKEIISPCEILLNNNKTIKYDDITTFDNKFSTRNKILAQKLNITEKEAFIIGNLGKYWSENLLKNRKIYISNNNLIYQKFNYKMKLINSPYVIKNNKFTNPYQANVLIKNIRKKNYQIYNIKTNTYSNITNQIPKDDYIVVEYNINSKKYKKNKYAPKKKESLAMCARLKNIHLPH